MHFKTNVKWKMNSLSFTYTLKVFLDISVLVANLWQMSCSLALGFFKMLSKEKRLLVHEQLKEAVTFFFPQNILNCLFEVRLTFGPWLDIFPPKETKDNHIGSAARNRRFLLFQLGQRSWHQDSAIDLSQAPWSSLLH